MSRPVWLLLLPLSALPLLTVSVLRKELEMLQVNKPLP